MRERERMREREQKNERENERKNEKEREPERELEREWEKYIVWKMHTLCPRSSNPFYIATYYIKWVTTSWTHSIFVFHILFIDPNNGIFGE